MPDTPTKPPGFYVNWSTVTGVLAILAMIGGLYVYVWNTAVEAGRREAEVQQLRERLQKAEKDAETAARLAAAASGGVGHEEKKK